MVTLLDAEGANRQIEENNAVIASGQVAGVSPDALMSLLSQREVQQANRGELVARIFHSPSGDGTFQALALNLDRHNIALVTGYSRPDAARRGLQRVIARMEVPSGPQTGSGRRG